jgi:phosphate transport system protein
MNALAKTTPPDAIQLTSYLAALTLRACQYTSAAVLSASEALLRQEVSALYAVQESERELDRIDREFDERIAGTLAHASAEQARELLACLKFVLDLERITDLVAAFATRAQSVGARLEPPDVAELSRMLALLGSMLNDIYDGLSRRDTERSFDVIRADAELDRLRNLVLIRHLDGQSAARLSESIQVVAMAQCLERAGDHVKNLAEEVCHLVTGHSLRHVTRTREKSAEQMYVEHLRRSHLRRE